MKLFEQRSNQKGVKNDMADQKSVTDAGGVISHDEVSPAIIANPQAPSGQPNSGKNSKPILAASIILIVVAIGASYLAYSKFSNRAPKTSIIGGKEYVIEDFTTKGLSKEQQQPTTPDRVKEIAALEEKIKNNSHPAYADYLALAQLYVTTSNNEKAIKNYELAKANYDSGAQDHKEVQASLDELIANLKKEN